MAEYNKLIRSKINSGVLFSNFMSKIILLNGINSRVKNIVNKFIS